ncbi:radical SAM protein [Rhodocytophaga rosea]|uniref:Radical SAM protein n=1 Tax=Rhodocytophaga rosea TaxID=2704465 RepID=A0A6C0GBK4_9BACT|nr:radical SAM protein [Rhodocytophaga rosea]QHT65359.1 radical SAM protein [Rhodocytophaga rosea]
MAPAFSVLPFTNTFLNQVMSLIRPFNYILLKLASTCNINCSYCYWFRDETVLTKSKILSEEAETNLLAALGRHLKKYKLRDFSILLHGGEPLLFGKKRFIKLCKKLNEVTQENHCKLFLSITTNGILIDDEWCSIFNQFNIRVTVSIDGPPSVHDSRRLDFKDKGTSKQVIESFFLLRKHNIQTGVLGVCKPDTDPVVFRNFYVNELKVSSFDILVPDATHEDNPEKISTFYKSLFDIWLSEFSSVNLRIRFIETIVKGIMGYRSTSESIGYRPVSTITILTDGSIEPLDVFRIAGNASTNTGLNVSRDDIQDLSSHPLWLEIRNASLNLHSTCKNCEFHDACGGGIFHQDGLI